MKMIITKAKTHAAIKTTATALGQYWFTINFVNGQPTTIEVPVDMKMVRFYTANAKKAAIEQAKKHLRGHVEEAVHVGKRDDGTLFYANGWDTRVSNM